MTARVIVKNEMIGSGCFVQLVALIVAVLGLAADSVAGIIITLLAVGAFFYGSTLSQKWICSECRNPVDSNKVRICPACHVQLQS